MAIISSIGRLFSNHYDANEAGGHREPSAGLGKGPRSGSAVGSRRSIKEGHLSCYYTTVKREVISVNEEVKSDMWERKKGPLRRRKAQRMHSTKNRK